MGQHIGSINSKPRFGDNETFNMNQVMLKTLEDHPKHTWLLWTSHGPTLHIWIHAHYWSKSSNGSFLSSVESWRNMQRIWTFSNIISLCQSFPEYKEVTESHSALSLKPHVTVVFRFIDFFPYFPFLRNEPRPI